MTNETKILEPITGSLNATEEGADTFAPRTPFASYLGVAEGMMPGAKILAEASPRHCHSNAGLVRTDRIAFAYG